MYCSQVTVYIIMLFSLLIFIEVSLSFGSSSHDVDENVGAVQLELTLDGAIECCSVSVTVKVEDITAKGNAYIHVYVTKIRTELADLGQSDGLLYLCVIQVTGSSSESPGFDSHTCTHACTHTHTHTHTHNTHNTHTHTTQGNINLIDHIYNYSNHSTYGYKNIKVLLPFCVTYYYVSYRRRRF